MGVVDVGYSTEGSCDAHIGLDGLDGGERSSATNARRRFREF